MGGQMCVFGSLLPGLVNTPALWPHHPSPLTSLAFAHPEHGTRTRHLDPAAIGAPSNGGTRSDLHVLVAARRVHREMCLSRQLWGCVTMMGSTLRLLATILCLSQAWLVSCTVTPLSFRSEPLSTVQRLGGVVRLRCSTRPSTARLSWHFRGQLLDLRSTPGVRVRSGSLTLPSLDPSLEGLYQCVAHLDSGAIASRLARVSIAGISEFAETRRRTLTVNDGSTALIECQLPQSDPPALPRLQVRGEWLEESTEYLNGFFISRVILSLFPREGADSPSPARIIFPTSPQTLSVMQSESLTLECVVSQRLSVTIHWTKDGKTLQEGHNYRLSHNNLLLAAVKKTDRGNYQCSFQAETGNVVSANYTVNVLGKELYWLFKCCVRICLRSTFHLTCSLSVP
ncbi:cell adhesion molecule-related/down-regulated by oncogenes precursor-like [Arapaima gigas]